MCKNTTIGIKEDIKNNFLNLKNYFFKVTNKKVTDSYFLGYILKESKLWKEFEKEELINNLKKEYLNACLKKPQNISFEEFKQEKIKSQDTCEEELKDLEK